MDNLIGIAIVTGLIFVSMLLYWLYKQRKNFVFFETEQMDRLPLNISTSGQPLATDEAPQLPTVEEFDKPESIPAGFQKFHIPDAMQEVMRQTVQIGYPVFNNMKSYKVHFSQETMEELKNGTMQLLARQGKKVILHLWLY
ncbi:hypothetical protein [Sporosarcina trichiuri]|uniref:hypothetical protein n=1 Tax=Sporosarcina trichiuri TaxID=3056445 RepID=UPI0025B5EDFA|nr:hypothetical protein [Sporosarcina sp. 0.2-SM1T-5]WJY26379.1 hypothetical protein QWT68_09810 [Sporosarcina sp. 0.2-SM1T-5]